jgi:hypothetical protein
MRRPHIFRVRLEAQDCDRLYTICRRRGTRPEALLTAVLEIVLRDGLIDAVIDDGESVAHSASEGGGASEAIRGI